MTDHCNLPPPIKRQQNHQRRAEATRRPLGTPEFVTGLENLLGRKIARRAPARKPTTDIPLAQQLELL
jgi:hypothetical protein